MISFAGAKKAREIVFGVLRDACMDGDLSISESLQAVKDIFAENSNQLYKIKATAESFDLKNIGSPFPKLEIINSVQDVALVRMLWVDASGQNRCRVRLLFVQLSNLYSTLYLSSWSPFHHLLILWIWALHLLTGKHWIKAFVIENIVTHLLMKTRDKISIVYSHIPSLCRKLS